MRSGADELKDQTEFAMSEITQLLSAIESGDESASDALLPMVYEELRRLARSRLAGEADGLTLQPTELVHEAYLRLVGGEAAINWNGRGHFFGAAAEAMRRILIDRARRRNARKHGGDRKHVPLDEGEISAPMDDDQKLLQLDSALDAFETYDANKARYVKLRYFAGLTNAEAANAVGVSPATGHRYWVFARAWLQKAMECDSI